MKTYRQREKQGSKIQESTKGPDESKIKVDCCFLGRESDGGLRVQPMHFVLSHTDYIIALPPGFAGEDRIYPGCHYRPKEIWRPAPRVGLLGHAAWYWH